jgi:hypothetical protein
LAFEVQIPADGHTSLGHRGSGLRTTGSRCRCAGMGATLIVYAITARNPGYGNMSILIVYAYSFVPVPVLLSGAMLASLVIAYCIALYLTIDLWADAIRGGSRGLQSGNPTGSLLEIAAVLSSFVVVVGFIQHEVERTLKLAFENFGGRVPGVRAVRFDLDDPTDGPGTGAFESGRGQQSDVVGTSEGLVMNCGLAAPYVADLLWATGARIPEAGPACE